jgi:cytochrome c-type biogenesis protein
MSSISSVGMLTAFTAGIVSFLSPCVLPLIPGYVSYVSGNRLAEGGYQSSRHLSTLGLSVCFVLGFSTVFVALGASATALSRLLLSYRYEASIFGGIVIILFGAFLTGLIPISWLQRDLRYHGHLRGGRPMSAYVLGLAFAFGWTPCIGPVLGAILTLSALSSTASTGIALLTIYSLGLGLPFLLSAAFADGVAQRLKIMRRTGRVLQLGAGAVLIAIGVAMVTGYMSVFSYWLLENIPLLAGIG